jgi:hypothetical protein
MSRSLTLGLPRPSNLPAGLGKKGLDDFERKEEKRQLNRWTFCLFLLLSQ